MKKYTDEELDAKQAKLDEKKSKLMFGRDKNPPVDLAEAIFRMMITCDDTYLVLNGHYKAQRTGASRSIEDLYWLAKSYWPEITYRDLYKRFIRLYPHSILIYSWCTVVNRRVHTTYFRYKFTKDEQSRRDTIDQIRRIIK